MYNPAPSLISLLCSPEGHPVPLTGVSISGEVFGAQARLVVRQRYRNKEPRPIEAIYTFPLPSDAVLVGFAMECEGRRLEGQVKEREEAFQTYDDALSAGHGAALLDQERPNVFTASVGNLLPGEETVIEATYVQRLGADEGALRLMIPTLVAPRYIPGAKEGDRTGHGASDPTSRVPDADRISPRIGAVKYGLSIDIVFDLGRDVVIESPSHSIDVSPAGQRRQRVAFQRDTVPLDRDLVLLASASGEAERASGAGGAGVVAERRRGKDGTFALTVVPDLFDRAGRAEARDVVFVVDVSGSMAGPSIEQARSAMRLCLRHLAEGDRFQIIAFSTSMSLFERSLVPFTQRTLSAADAWIANLNASGGTEMLEPLLSAVDALGAKGSGRSRIVVLLTDGQVGNEAEIAARVTEKASGVRVYTFGIGTNVSDALLRDLARRTKGDVEFIHPGERIDEKVTAQFAKATAARVEDVTLRFVGVDAGELAPSEPPPLVDGEPWVIYGRYSEPGYGHAEIRGKLRGETFYLQVPVELPPEADREGVAALWAAARIRELEDAETSLSGRRAESNKKRIAALSVEHQVASKYASFVVVERRTGDRRAHGQPEARPVPVSGPAGWSMGMPQQEEGGTATRAGTIKGNFSLAAYAPAAVMAAPAARAAAPMMMRRGGGASGGEHERARASAPSSGAPAAPPPASAMYSAPPPAASKGAIRQRSAMDAMDMEEKVLSAGPTESRSSPPAPKPAAPRSPMRAMGEAVIGAVGKLFGGKAEEGAAPAPPPPPASPPAAAPTTARPPAKKEAASLADPTALLERQLASGLWEGAEDTDASRLLATATALAACHTAGIDTAHSTYGAQIRKAVEAICKLVASGSVSGASAREVQAAIAAAYLVSSGKRLRAQVTAAAQGATIDAVQALARDLATSDAASRKLAELGIKA
jgi:Ca-activated chloride channel family protein